ncbi:hypothetical protein BV20DRAFT_1039587 [Pilatotrama ljubarskyi]|nr:hypothetical protein BV20DRAFT_1039587 [Pilatotrama ljubarskyi]
MEHRMRLRELLDVAAVLKILDPFIGSNRYRFSALEALCLLCACLRSPEDQHDLFVKYLRLQSAISELVNELTFYLDSKWSHLLAFNSSAPLRTIWGFIDCTICAICHPSLWQCQAYNGHKKFHAIKFHAVMLANGLFGHLYGPSRLLDWAQDHALQPSGDGPMEERYLKQEWNAEMVSIRIEVEHRFGIVYNSPVALYYHVGILLTNVINYIRPNQVAQYFSCLPPTLEDYYMTTLAYQAMAKRYLHT